MSEKPDIPTDTVSLPPNYAPSEAFTESPPPAYRQHGIAAVKIAKIICVTLLLMTFIVGFFVVAHKWVQSKESHYNEFQSTNQGPVIVPPPNSQKLIDNMQTEKQFASKQEEEEIDANQITREIEENQLEDEIIEDLQKEVKLPMDVLLGNPALTGRAKCKVQKKQQRLAHGIMAQAIIVTCDDEESSESIGDEPILEMLPIGRQNLNRPPMSLLGNLMKILASRPRSSETSLEEQRPILNEINGPFPFPMPRPIMRPNEGPFQRSISSGVVHMIPVNRMELRRPNWFSEGNNNGPSPIIMSSRGPLPNMRPIHFTHRIIGSPHPMRPTRLPNFFNQRRDEVERLPLPFPLSFGNGPLPTKIIRISHNNNNEEEERNPMPLAPFHPFMNLVPGRRARIIHLRPREEEIEGPFSMNSPSMELSHMHLPPFKMPLEARGRALPAPVAIPEARVMRFPFSPQSQSIILPETRVSAGIEVLPSQQDEELNRDQESDQSIVVREKQNTADFGPPKIHSVIEAAPQNMNENEPESQFHPRFFAQSDAKSQTNEEEPIAQPTSSLYKMIIN